MVNVNITFYIFIFVFGTIIGSFLNVVICRHGTGRSLGGRSKCDVTGKTLRWYELVPILSFLVQGGRSRYSKTKISWQDPLVEFFTGIVFVLIAHKFSELLFIRPELFFVNTLFYFVVFSFLILIFVYDFRHKIIPEGFLHPLFVLSIVSILFFSYQICTGLRTPTIIEAISGFIVAMPLLLLFLLTKGRGMGFGDVKLAVPFGYLLGVSAGFASLLMAFWIGAAAGLLLITGGSKKWKSEIPFGPFLIVGFTFAFLYNIDMISIARFFGSLI